MDINNVNLDDTKGFNVLNGKSIFAHYTNEKTEEIHNNYTNYLTTYSINNEQVIALPEEDTIFIDNDKTSIIGHRPYYEFNNGEIKKNEPVQLVPYTDDNYDFVYDVKKNAYKKYVEQCWGEWNDINQKNRFQKSMEKSQDKTYIIMFNNEKIGFYQGELVNETTYYIENICIISEYQGKGIGTEILKSILDKYSDKNVEIQYFKTNPVGKLYERLGFKIYEETVFHYKMRRLV